MGEYLKEGVAFVATSLPDSGFFTPLPVHLMRKAKEPSEFRLNVGQNPTFFLKKEGKLTHALINGFLIDLSKPLEDQHFGNALIF